MNDLKVPTIPTLSVNQMCEQLSRAYVSVISQDLPLRLIPSVMLWGAPGVGKSQGVRQLAERIKQETGKQVHVTDVRLLLFIRSTCAESRLPMQTKHLQSG